MRLGLYTNRRTDGWTTRNPIIPTEACMEKKSLNNAESHTKVSDIIMRKESTVKWKVHVTLM